jgi:DUF4097 and DUF4098 domain-containing protein YvlB
MRRLPALAGVLVMLALLHSQVPAAREYTFHYQKIVEVPEPLNFKLALTKGRVVITGTQDTRAVITAVKRVHAPNPEEAQRVADHVEIRTEQTARGLEISTNYQKIRDRSPSFWQKLFGAGDDAYGGVDYEISLPTLSSVNVTIMYGDVAVSGVEGEVTVHAESGTTTGEFLFGPVTVVQPAGEVDLQWIEGDIRVRTQTARVNVRQLLGALDIATSSGNITVQTELDSPRDYFVETSSGKVTFSIPEASSGTLNIQTEAGDIEMDLPVTVKAASKRRLVGEFGIGGPSIHITTSTGRVTVAEY